MRAVTRKDIFKKKFTEYIFDLDYGELTVNFDEDGYALFNLHLNGEPNIVETYFGLEPKDRAELARILIQAQRYEEQ